jgi:4-hydroxybenzoate polyprenyltransferase
MALSKMALPELRALVELVRAPAALTVPGDLFAGAAAAGFPFGPATPALAASSVCLYWAGMALNDFADREVDAVERPDRPVPSGRVRAGFALGVAAGLTAAGLSIAAAVGGRRALVVAVPLAGTVWAYDLWLKSRPAGPVAMATARGLDVLLGAGVGHLRAAAPAALAMGAHTLAVTVLSRGEVRGGDRWPAGAALIATGVVGGWAAATGRTVGGRTTHRLAGAALLALYGGSVGRPQWHALRAPTAARVRRAVGAGILGMMPLQAALAARSGALWAALPVAAAFPLARKLSRRVSPT